MCVTLNRNFLSYVCHFICNTACCCFLYKYYHGKQMENSASYCCTVRTQTQCLCDMAAWIRCRCITLQIILLCLTVLSIGCKVHRHKVSMITVIFKKKIVFILGDTGPGVLEWIKMVWKEEFQFPHIKLIYPTADPM